MKGTVKNFNKNRGFGFITTEEGKDIFFHFSVIVDAEKTAEIGDKVELEVIDSPRGPRAASVKKIVG